MDESFFALPAEEPGGGIMPTPEDGPWRGPPGDVPGIVVPTPTMTARSALAEITVRAVRAYPEGIEFEVEASAISPDKSPHELYADSMARPMANNRPPDVVLRFGVQLADGVVATTLRNPVAPLSKPDHHVLWRYAGSGDHIDGDTIRTQARLWLWPLPPPGPMVFVTEWPEFGIGTTSWELDGSQARDAAQPMR
jgi:hypothetical protein